MAPSSLLDTVSEYSSVLESQHLPKNFDQPKQEINFALYRRLVPLVSNGKITHLNAGFMPPSNLVVSDAISRYCSESLYHESPKGLWKQDVEQLRALLGRYAKVDPSTIAFVRDTTEGLGSFMHGLRCQPGDNVVILDCEHPNQAYGWLALRPAGVEVRVVPTPKNPQNAANADTFAPFVDSKTRAIGLSSVMFHNGQLNDVADVCGRFRPLGVHVLADLTQQVGFSQVDLGALGASAVAFSLHKGLNTPIGLAALYVETEVIRELNPIPPLVGYGGISNTSEDAELPEGPIEFHPTARRYEHANMGWVNAVAAKSFLELYLDIMGPANVERHLYTLGDALRRDCKKLGISIAGPPSAKEHSSHLYVLQLHDERWLNHLKTEGIMVTKLVTGIRVSFGFYNHQDDIQKLMGSIQRGIKIGISL